MVLDAANQQRRLDSIADYYEIFGKAFIDKLERGSSLLIDTYQLICNKKFISHVKPPKSVVLTSSTTPMKAISNKITIRIMEYFDEKLGG